MSLPNFLIVGAAKSGTTTLHDALSQHPDVYMPARKEPCFFAAEGRVGVETLNEYEALFEPGAGKAARGEASVAYLYDSSAPGKIAAVLGRQVKIIIMLRNPIDMMYSLWGHMRREQREDLDFLEAINAETERMRSERFRQATPGWVCDLYYVDRARYASQVKRYIDQFGASSVNVSIAEEFFPAAERELAGLYRFIGVDDGFKPAIRRLNPAGVSRSRILHQVLNRDVPGKELAKGVLHQKIRASVKAVLNSVNRKNRSLEPLPDSIRMDLWKIVENDVAELEVLLNRELAPRWAPKLAT